MSPVRCLNKTGMFYGEESKRAEGKHDENMSSLHCFASVCFSSFMFFSFTFSWIGSYHVPCLPASFSGCPLSHAGRCWHQSQGWSAGRRPRRPPKSKTWRWIAHGAGQSHGWEMAPPAMLLDVWSFRIPHLQMPKEGLECVKDVRPNPDVAPHLQSSSSSTSSSSSPSH